MKDLQPYEPETLDYQFPTSLPATPSGLTPYQKQQREIDFINHVAFQRRRIVTFIVVALCVGILVTHIVTHGINRTGAFATVIALAVAYRIKNYTTPKHSGTKQIYHQ